MSALRAAVIGAGAFGRNHIRIIRELPDVELASVIDEDSARLSALSLPEPIHRASNITELPSGINAAIVATPTHTHEKVASALLARGIDVLVEKPIASSSAAGDRLTRLAEESGRILQVGHLERFNPAVVALRKAVTVPLFFEIHRLSVFTPRSLDIDVVLDLMIHDLDIVLSLVNQTPDEIRAAGIRVLSPKVDIANVRLAFANGCVANLTASRVSTEQVRKLRLFQPGQYISVDYSRQDAAALAVSPGTEPNSAPQIGFRPLSVEKHEPLQQELLSFFESVRTRSQPIVSARQATQALRVAEAILAKIGEHGAIVANTIRSHS